MIATLVLVVVGLVLLAFAGWTWAFYRYPKATLAFLSRRDLRKHGARLGFTRGPQGRLAYWTVGSGPTVALLHGAGDQAGTWAKVVPELAKRFRLLLPDFPGHERSEPLAGPLDHGDMIDAVEALLDHEAAGERVALIGNSMGGWAALGYAQRHPERVSALILEDSGGVSGPDLRVLLAPQTREEARDLLKLTFGPGLPEPKRFVLDDLLRRTRTGPIARMLETDATPYLLDGKLGGVTAPAHLVWGEHDRLLPLDYAKRLAAELPRAKIHVLAGCGHIPHLVAPDAFRELVEKVLADPEGELER